MSNLKLIVITSEEMYSILQKHFDEAIPSNQSKVVDVRKREAGSSFFKSKTEFVIEFDSKEKEEKSDGKK